MSTHQAGGPPSGLGTPKGALTGPSGPPVVDPSGRVLRRRLTVGICATVVSIAFETIAVATAMPVAARDLDGLRYYAWAFSSFVIGMLFATVVSGRYCDRIGPAKPFLAGLVVFLAGLVLAGTAGSMTQLIGGRLVQGLGSGTMNVAVFVTVARVFSVTQRPRMFTYISTAWVLPSFLGPPISAWLTNQLSWHWVFFAVIPVTLFGGAMVLPTLRAMIDARDSADAAPGPPAPLWAAALVGLSAAALQLAGQRLDLVAVGLGVAGLAGLLVGLPRLMPAGFLRFRRGLSQVISTRGLLAGAFVGAEAFVPLMLVEQRQAPLLLAGAVLTVGSVGWTIGSFLQSRPWLRIRRDRLITFGCVSVTVGLALVGLIALLPGVGYGWVALSWVFCGLGMGLATSSTSLAAMTLSGDAEQGRNASSLNLADALGAGLLVGAAGTIFAALRPTGDLSLTFATVQLAMAAVCLIGVATSLRIGVIRNEFAPR